MTLTREGSALSRRRRAIKRVQVRPCVHLGEASALDEIALVRRLKRGKAFALKRKLRQKFKYLEIGYQITKLGQLSLPAYC